MQAAVRVHPEHALAAFEPSKVSRNGLSQKVREVFGSRRGVPRWADRMLCIQGTEGHLICNLLRHKSSA